jgi:hypothetical protein
MKYLVCLKKFSIDNEEHYFTNKKNEFSQAYIIKNRSNVLFFFIKKLIHDIICPRKCTLVTKCLPAFFFLLLFRQTSFL